MPELPEVEIVCRNLEQLIGNAEIRGWIFFRNDLRFKIPKQKLRSISGQKISKVKRRAKYILLELESVILISHLGMTGSWRSEKANWKKRKHDHLAFEYDEKRFMVYEDPRRFGFIEVVKKTELLKRFKNLGLEPLQKDFPAEDIELKFKKLNSAIKVALMNQKYVVGVGNIYACEALFRAGINPLKKCSSIKREKLKKLWSEVRAVLNEAILSGGSTIENYRNGFGQAGDFQKEFFVYGRSGEKCFRCSSSIKSQLQAGRTTFWCTECQR